jgi:hypothetical protein
MRRWIIFVTDKAFVFLLLGLCGFFISLYLESVYKLPIFSMSQRAECASSDKFSISYVQGQL